MRAVRRLEEKCRKLSTGAHFVHTIAKQVISRRGLDENDCKMYPWKACKNAVNVQIYDVPVSVVVMLAAGVKIRLSVLIASAPIK